MEFSVNNLFSYINYKIKLKLFLFQINLDIVCVRYSNWNNILNFKVENYLKIENYITIGYRHVVAVNYKHN